MLFAETNSTLATKVFGKYTTNNVHASSNDGGGNFTYNYGYYTTQSGYSNNSGSITSSYNTYNGTSLIAINSFGDSLSNLYYLFVSLKRQQLAELVIKVNVDGISYDMTISSSNSTVTTYTSPFFSGGPIMSGATSNVQISSL